MNNWIYHLKDYAKENKISYAEAVKDPECRKQYYDNLGKKPPPKVKKIVKVLKEMIKTKEPNFQKLLKSDAGTLEIKMKKPRAKITLIKNEEPPF